MVENIAIVGLDREQSYETAKLLASELDMHFLDTIELFEFDNIPRTLSDMIKEYGLLYFRKKEKGALKYASEFSQTLIHCESGMAMRKANFDNLKTNCLVIYLHNSASVVERKIKSKKYKTIEEAKLFKISLDQIKNRIANLKKYSDIIVDAKNKSTLKLASEVLRKIKEFYGVN